MPRDKELSQLPKTNIIKPGGRYKGKNNEVFVSGRGMQTPPSDIDKENEDME